MNRPIRYEVDSLPIRCGVKALLQACNFHRDMTSGQRKQLAHNLRTVRNRGHRVVARYSDLLGRFVVWAPVYIPPVSSTR